MPILNDFEEDTLVWWRSRNGNYSVKSAYYVFMEELVDHSVLRMDGDWMSIWKLKVPQKVKLLLRRANRGCLPTRCNLQSKHVPCDWLCPLCKRNRENKWHICFDCVQVEPVWPVAGLLQQIQTAIESA